MSWVVYMVSCNDGTIYTGISNDVKKRVRAHNNGTGAKYTKLRRPVKLVYQEEATNRSLAQKREVAIKGFKRTEKLELIKNSARQK